MSVLLVNVKIKTKLLYPVSHDASVLHDLCSMLSLFVINKQQLCHPLS